MNLRCLNTVCARSTICTADVNKRAHKALRKTNMAPVGACTAIISFSSVKIGRVFSVLTIKQFVMFQKRLFFNVLKVILLENTLPFWDCLYGSRKLKIENPVKCSAYAVNQKIVTARFSGNALISTEPLVRIS